MDLPDIRVSEETRKYIAYSLIEPSYKDEISDMITGRKYWKMIGQIFETISKIMVAAGSIVSFSAGYYKNFSLSFIAGSISCLSLALLQFSSFCYIQHKKQSTELNVLLRKLDIDTIPILETNLEKVNLLNTMPLD
jgi:hypothetical protein